jgi:hypothetical protein
LTSTAFISILCNKLMKLKSQFVRGLTTIDNFNQAEKGGRKGERPEVINLYGDMDIDSMQFRGRYRIFCL